MSFKATHFYTTTNVCQWIS